MQSNQPNIPALGVYGKCMLAAIVLLLGILALRPMSDPVVASAQSNYAYLYVEPGTTMLRNPDGTQQLEGKLVIDLRNGNIWGFPTMASTPYPVNTMKSEPPVSSPMYLGKFDLSKITVK